MRYYEKIDFMHRRPLWLPWPMTAREAVGHLLTCVVFTIVSLAVVIWLSGKLIEPSLWRVVPTIVWACALRYAIFPTYRRLIVPRDLDRRLAAVRHR